MRVSVPADGGVDYELSVHPDYVTNLYFPDVVQRAWNSNQDAFDVSGKGKVLHIRAKTAEPADGNIAVVTATLKVGVHIAVGAKKDAVFQVFFEPPDVDSAVESVVRERVGQERATLEREFKVKERSLNTEFGDQLLKAVSNRVSINSLDRIARSNSHVIVRLMQVVFVGDIGHLVLDIQNRSGRSFSLASITVISNEKKVSSRFAMRGEGNGAIPDGARRRAVVQIQPGEADRPLSVVVKGKTGDAVRIKNVQLP